jgi:hypothetical protein
MHCNLWPAVRKEREEWKTRLKSLAPKLKPRDKQIDWAVAIGNFSGIGSQPPKRVVRIFVSSTFTDTALERNFVLEDVMPYLKECALYRGLEVVFSEMRFGIRESSSEDNLTSEICMNELKHCQDDSAGVSYILLACDKYGFRPSPSRIPKNEFESLLANMQEKEQLLARTIYELDENQLGKLEYTMVNQRKIKGKISTTANSSVWDVMREVQLAFRRAALKLWPDGEEELRNPRRFSPCDQIFMRVCLSAVRFSC